MKTKEDIDKSTATGKLSLLEMMMMEVVKTGCKYSCVDYRGNRYTYDAKKGLCGFADSEYSVDICNIETIIGYYVKKRIDEIPFNNWRIVEELSEFDIELLEKIDDKYRWLRITNGYTHVFADKPVFNHEIMSYVNDSTKHRMLPFVDILQPLEDNKVYNIAELIERNR